jgi:hypothetical protein
LYRIPEEGAKVGAKVVDGFYMPWVAIVWFWWDWGRILQCFTGSFF